MTVPVARAAVGEGRFSPRCLSEDERIVIADMLRAGSTLCAIARHLARSPATISREVRRNRDARTGKYHPFRAQRRATVRRARSKEGKVRRDLELKTYIQQRSARHALHRPRHAHPSAARRHRRPPGAPPLGRRPHRRSAQPLSHRHPRRPHHPLHGAPAPARRARLRTCP